MNTTTRGGARRQKLAELLPVVGAALVVALGVAMVVGPSTSNIAARLSHADGSASLQAGSLDATSPAGVTVQVRPRRAGTPPEAQVAPAALVTGDLGRVVLASTSRTGPSNSTSPSPSSTGQTSKLRIAPVSATPLLVSPSDVRATPSAAPAAPLLVAPVALPPAPEVSVAAAPTKQPSKALKPAKTTSPTTAAPKAGRGSSPPLTGGAVAVDPSPIAGGGVLADTTAKAAAKADASAEKAAEKAADKVARSESSAKPATSTKKDKA